MHCQIYLAMIGLKNKEMVQATEPKTVIIYQDDKGKELFTEWLDGLRDQRGRRFILRRIGKLEQGLYGDCRPVGEGVSELRIFFGPGYRVYFGEEAGHMVILLCGGDKDSQDRDIQAAKAYWKEYKDHG
ncbi:MAG: addiction module killer protein [Nitrosomonas europaea]|nr:MAG: addiction module killer protein [Nitrosomonas europaea]